MSETERIQKAYNGETMTESIETTSTEQEPAQEQEQAPTINIPIAAILPIETKEGNKKVGLLLLVDGTVRWSELEE
tara:strand:- start:582 stop:809 length:228 start_codon:yes stop_codon:yes gene_type:complete